MNLTVNLLSCIYADLPVGAAVTSPVRDGECTRCGVGVRGHKRHRDGRRQQTSLALNKDWIIFPAAAMTTAEKTDGEG